MLNWLRTTDHDLFHTINKGWSNSFFDHIMPFFRNPASWIPLYIIVLLTLIYRFKIRFYIPVIAILIALLLTDQFSASFIKPLVHRPRPCHVFNGSEINLLAGCGSGYSFVSSHAANSFGFSMMMIFIFSHRFRFVIPLACGWAFMISIAQVYVGLHYPGDVFCGALVGMFFGLLCGIGYKFAMNRIK